jgi:copper chaperone
MMTTTNLRVTGMSCGHCVRAVAEALEGLEGVTKAKVTLEGGRAEVEHDAERAPASALVAAVREEGYEAEAEAS